ncbi:GTP-binding protein EngB required for normal cell division [Bacillus niacini]|uniref:GTP-binding protein EngB required for normal cell division n=1 Tax=Neobacillus niacini TaxID=86668 RepID=A0A852TET5_9BACI|nr:hemolysin XhlA family protein [Neobacillus niacini]NYE07272.1 GTP-binding protein EngB required for normal cell division [Neobacillus niacini]
MTEPTTRELYDKINQMAIDLSVMNTKMDFVMDSKKTAERAEQKADKALQKIDDLADDIAAIKTTAKWAIGLTITAVLSLAGIVINGL